MASTAAVFLRRAFFSGFSGLGGLAVKRSTASSGGFDGRGEHEAERVEEAHAGFGEGAGEGALGGVAEVGFEHDGVADLGYVDAGGYGDAFFDERLFDADAHVAEHELEQVFGVERGALAEQAFDERGADGGGSGGGHGGESCGDFAELEAGAVEVVVAEDVVGGGAHVAVAAVGGGEFGVGGLAYELDGFAEEGSAAALSLRGSEAAKGRPAR